MPREPAWAAVGWRKPRFVPELIVPDPQKSVREGAIKPWRIGGKNLIIRHNALLKQLAEQLPFDPDLPWQDLPASTREVLLEGAGDRRFAFKLKRMREAKAMAFEGVVADLQRSYLETDSDGFRARLSTYMVAGPCPDCHGRRLSAFSSAVKLSLGDRPLSFSEFLALDVSSARTLAREWTSMTQENEAVREVVQGIDQRLHFLEETGLGYLTLQRDYATLSGGEAQRVRLATQLGMGLIGVIYVLDEPSIGLHAHDNEKLLETLRALRDREIPSSSSSTTRTRCARLTS